MTNEAPEAARETLEGVFITFEGGEGAGKSTQVARLAAFLRERLGREVVTTREPGGTERAEAIREAVLSGAAKPYGPFAEALLFCAARIDHLDRLIRPALGAGAVVLCDRFSDSTRAYQGAAGGVGEGVLRALERVSVGPTRPHLTLILDLAPETGLARARDRARAAATITKSSGQKARGTRKGTVKDPGAENAADPDGTPTTGEEADRFEAEALGFHERLRAAFRAIAEAEPERCALIEAGAEPDAVETAIRAAVAARLPMLALSRDGAGKEPRENAA